jgi:hypothetical protein
LQERAGEQAVVCVGVGEKALQHLPTLCAVKRKTGRLFVAASVHQYFNELKELADKQCLDLVAIPAATVKDEEKKKVIESLPHHCFTLGVPTKNPSLEELKAAYEGSLFKKNAPPNSSIIAVMLPGDAPANDGAIRLFTRESARSLFEGVRSLWQREGKRHTLIVHNSPRTGKFGSAAGDVVCPHEVVKGQQPEGAVDQISQYFISLLREAEIPFHFFNFVFEIEGSKRLSNSIYLPLLFATRSLSTNYFILPGESVSMLSQVPLFLRPEQIIVFKPTSMNEQHLAILEEIFTKGHYSYFENDNNIRCPSRFTPLIHDDATAVARALLSLNTATIS